MPRVTAIVMPMMRPASMTSRKTMINAPSMRYSLLNNEKTFGRIFMIIVEETVTTGRQRAHLQGDGAARRDHLLDPQGLAFELGGRAVEIGDLDRERLARRRMRLRGLETMVLEGEFHNRRFLRQGAWRQGARREGVLAAKEGERKGQDADAARSCGMWLHFRLQRIAGVIGAKTRIRALRWRGGARNSRG